MGRSASAQRKPAVPPPSPPSPGTPDRVESDLCAPIEELSLDGNAQTTAGILPVPLAPISALSVPPLPVAQAAETTKADQTTSPGLASSNDAVVVPSMSPPATAPASKRGSAVASPILNPVSGSVSGYGSGSSSGSGSATKSPVRLHAASAAPPVPADVAARLSAGAVHVLATEAQALQSVAELYGTSRSAIEGFAQAVDVIVRTQTAQPPGKLVVVGVGKSGHIGRKLVATFNSLALPASFMHPTEALHGDLGHVQPHDALMFITYSGKTQELASLLPHLDPALPLLLLTAHLTTETCALVQHRSELHGLPGNMSPSKQVVVGPTVLLPAPIPVEEKVAFGVSAPTSSTTTALAVGDALAIVASKELHASVLSVFHKNHPGGAIGAAAAASSSSSSAAATASHQSSSASEPSSADTLRHLAVPWCDIPIAAADGTAAAASSSVDVLPASAADVLRAGYGSGHGWVRISGTNGNTDGSDFVAAPSRIRALGSMDLGRPAHEVPGLAVGRADLVVMAADTKARSAAEWLRAAAADKAAAEENGTSTDAVIAVAENGEIVGVLELKDLLAAHEQ